MSLEGQNGELFLSFLYKVSGYLGTTAIYWSFIVLFMEAMDNTINEFESLSSLKKEDLCGKYFFKASKEATVHKAKLLTYPHIAEQLVKKRHEESEVPSKHKWPLKTRCSTGIDNTERKFNFWTCIGLQFSRRNFNQRIRGLLTTKWFTLHRH